MAGRSGPGHRCHLRNRARRLIPGGRRRRGRSRRGAAPPAGGAGGVPRLQPGPPGASPPHRPSPVGPGPGAPGAALRARTARAEEAQEPATSTQRLGCARPPPTPAPQPPPGSPRFPGLRRARPPPPIQATPEETEAGQARGTYPRSPCPSDPSRKVSPQELRVTSIRKSHPAGLPPPQVLSSFRSSVRKAAPGELRLGEEGKTRTNGSMEP